MGRSSDLHSVFLCLLVQVGTSVLAHTSVCGSGGCMSQNEGPVEGLTRKSRHNDIICSHCAKQNRRIFPRPLPRH